MPGFCPLKSCQIGLFYTGTLNLPRNFGQLGHRRSAQKGYSEQRGSELEEMHFESCCRYLGIVKRLYRCVFLGCAMLMVDSSDPVCYFDNDGPDL